MMAKTIVMKTIRKTARPFVAAAVAMALLVPTVPVLAQDALTSRYQAIRQPGQTLATQTARQRLQAELNALERAQTRARIELRSTERLGFQDPVSRLPAQEQALRAELNRIETDLRAATAELQRVDRSADAAPVVVVDVPGVIAGDAPVPRSTAPGPAALSPEEAAAAARAFVDDLLRANRARP